MGSMSVLSSTRHDPISASSSLSNAHFVQARRSRMGRRGDDNGDDGRDRMPDQMIVPKSGWKDHYGLNEVLVKGTIGPGESSRHVDGLACLAEM